MTPPAGVADPAKRRHFRYNAFLLLLFTRCATSNASRHFKSPLAIGRDAFKSKHASSVSISEVIDTGVNSNAFFTFIRVFLSPEMDSDSFSIFHEREMKYRISCAQDQGIPIANYGMVIAYIHGILKRSLSPFPEIEKLL